MTKGRNNRTRRERAEQSRDQGTDKQKAVVTMYHGMSASANCSSLSSYQGVGGGVIFFLINQNKSEIDSCSISSSHSCSKLLS